MDLNSLIWEVEDIDVSRHFGVHVCGARVSLALALARKSHSPPLEPLSQPGSGCQFLLHQRQCSTPAWELLSQLLSGQRTKNPTWGRTQEGWGVPRAVHEMGMCLNPSFTCNSLSTEHSWNPGAGSYMCPFLYLLWLSSNFLFLEFLYDLELNALRLCKIDI